MYKSLCLVFVALVLLSCPYAQAEVEPFSHPYVSALAISQKGNILASAGSDGIRLWNVRSGELLKTLPGHKIINPCGPGEIWATTGLAFVTENTLLSSGKDGNIHLWNVRDGTLLRSIVEPWVYRLGGVDSLAWLRRVPFDAIAISHDGQYVVASVFGTVQLWELATGKHIRSYGAERLRSESIAVEDLVSAQEVEVLHDFLNLPEQVPLPKELKRWKASRPVLDDLHQVSLSPDLTRVVAAGAHTTYVWDFHSGDHLFEVEGASYFTISPDSKILMTGDRFGPIQTRNLSTGRQLRTLQVTCRGIQFAPSGGHFVSADSVSLWRWSTETWTKERSFPDDSPGGEPQLFVISPNSEFLVATWEGWDERRIRVWRLAGE